MGSGFQTAKNSVDENAPGLIETDAKACLKRWRLRQVWACHHHRPGQVEDLDLAAGCRLGEVFNRETAEVPRGSFLWNKRLQKLFVQLFVFVLAQCFFGQPKII